MATIEGLKTVRKHLNQLKRMYTVTDSVTVGFAQAYALFVHENRGEKLRGKKRPKPAKGTFWGPHGQSKYLEEPARNLSSNGEFTRIAKAALKSGLSIETALVLMGLRLQRDAQERVPIDTGALRASGFTSKTSKAEAAIAKAYQKSEALRVAKLKKRGQK